MNRQTYPFIDAFYYLFIIVLFGLMFVVYYLFFDGK